MRRIEAQLLFFLLAVTLALSAAQPSVAQVEEVEEVDILAVSPEMAQFIDSRVRTRQARSARVQALLSAMFGKNGLDIVYGDNETKTAVETFESGSGNCLSFTLLFVALARHIGLEAYFQEVGEILSWDRRGDVAVNNRHMFAEIETINGMTRVDFLPGVEKRYRLVRRIDERRVLAHYYSNLGAEALTQDDFEGAMRMFQRAVEADETLAAAWTNMGVTHRRLGELEAAERSYLRALELDPGEIPAASNLASLYTSSGRERLAGPYIRQVRRHRDRNPFWHFREGTEAAAAGELGRAARKLRRAISMLPNDAMFRAELGKVQERSGQPRRAARSYAKALKLSDNEGERRILEQLLSRLRAAA
jgi:Flp pilus assembly protein TadD